MDKFRTMSAMLPAIVIVAIIAGVLIGLLGRYWAIRRGDVDTPRDRVGKDESKRRCYRIKYLAEANRNRHAGIDTSGYDYL